MSSGRPRERELYADVRCAWHVLRTRYGLLGREIILYGQSIGSVAAIDLAAHLSQPARAQRPRRRPRERRRGPRRRRTAQRARLRPPRRLQDRAHLVLRPVPQVRKSTARAPKSPLGPRTLIALLCSACSCLCSPAASACLLRVLHVRSSCSCTCVCVEFTCMLSSRCTRFCLWLSREPTSMCLQCTPSLAAGRSLAHQPAILSGEHCRYIDAGRLSGVLSPRPAPITHL